MSDVGPTLETARLTLRRWGDADREPFRRINADPQVMQHFPATLTAEESDSLIAHIEAHFECHGFGLWAVERRADRQLLGFTGLAVPRFDAPFMPAVEIGWRLGAVHWRQGHAREAARAVLAFAFETLGIEALVSFTVPANSRSIAVMRAIGMQEDEAAAFDHPLLPPGHALRPHVLYRIDQPTWRGLTGS